MGLSHRLQVRLKKPWSSTEPAFAIGNTLCSHLSPPKAITPVVNSSGFISAIDAAPKKTGSHT